MEAQNVPFENSTIQIETEEDTFVTSPEPSKFPKFNQNYKFYNLKKEDNVTVSLIDENSDGKYYSSFQVNEFIDQKLHDKWITLVDPSTDRITDIKARLVIHYVYSPVPLCEEAILGWENHLSKLK